MNMKKERIAEKLLLFLVFAAILTVLAGQLHTGQFSIPDKVTEVSDGWYYLEDGRKTSVSLPAVITLDTDRDLVLYCDGLSENNAGQILTTRGAIFHMSVTLGRITLYQYDDSGFPRNTQMASKVNCTAKLPSNYKGQTLAFTYKNTDHQRFEIGSVYIGDPLNVFFYHCFKDAATLMSIFMMAILSIITVCVSLYLKYMGIPEKRFADIAFFLFFCVCWFLSDSSFAQIFIGSLPIVRYMSFYAFMLLSVPMLHFIKNTRGMQDSAAINVIIYLFYGNVILQSILNYLGLFDFVDMLFVTHILLFGGVAWVLFLLIHTYQKNKDNELRSILSAFAVVAGGGVISLILYWLLEISFYEVFFEVGIVLFIILLIRMLVVAMVDNLRFKTETMVYQRLAKEDSMTGLKNRRAFDEFLEKHAPHLDMYENLYLIFMDLNQLKNTNDTYGHRAGDELIIAAARCVEHAFGSMGSCFRIGGDEFCAILPNISLTEEELSGRLDDELRRYNSSCGKYSLSLARGISNIRDENGTLKNISDWKKEADMKMYQNKGWVRRVEQEE